jgi:antitoxin HicB
LSGTVAKRHVHTGSRFDEFLKEEGIFEEVRAKALKRAVAEQLEESMHAAKFTKLDMARKMATSRSQLDRGSDPSNVSVQLDTLIKAARGLGKEIEIKIKWAHKKAARGVPQLTKPCNHLIRSCFQVGLQVPATK